MMCARLVRPHTRQTGLNALMDRCLRAIERGYRNSLQRLVGRPWLFGAIMVLAVAISGVLFVNVPRELAPPEDRGAFFTLIQGPEGAGFDYTDRKSTRLNSSH